MSLAVAVFVVEDEVAIQDILREALSDAGFDVTVASGGDQAMSELEAKPSHFKAIITDIQLWTGPTGWDIAKRARELDPKMPIVYMSGDGAPDWAALGVPNSVMIVKPFAAAQVITAVSALINEAGV